MSDNEMDVQLNEETKQVLDMVELIREVKSGNNPVIPEKPERSYFVYLKEVTPAAKKTVVDENLRKKPTSSKSSRASKLEGLELHQFLKDYQLSSVSYTRVVQDCEHEGPH